MSTNYSHDRIMKITGTAILTAVVVVLQLLGSFIRLGPFSISLVLVPIVIGAALYGVLVGGWLGLVFGATVLLSGDAAAFLVIDVFGTVLVVLLKGMLAGVAAGLAYSLIKNRNQYLAVIVAAIVCPIVNTGIFLLGCLVFFMDTIREWAAAFGYETAGAYMILGLVGLNFVFEMLVNIILSPVILRLLSIIRKEEN